MDANCKGTRAAQGKRCCGLKAQRSQQSLYMRFRLQVSVWLGLSGLDILGLASGAHAGLGLGAHGAFRACGSAKSGVVGQMLLV